MWLERETLHGNEDNFPKWRKPWCGGLENFGTLAQDRRGCGVRSREQRGSLLVDHDAAAADNLRIGRVHVVRSPRHIVIDHSRGVPDFDPEFIHATTARDLAIGDRYQERVIAPTIDRAGALVTGP